jgi:DNA-binding SARP family transcriptional activator
MNGLPFAELREPYSSFLNEGRWNEYLSSLCEDGLKWWFNMDTPAILAHLIPVESFPVEKTSLPERLVFLSEAAKLSIPVEKMDAFFKLFMAKGDFEAASAAAGAGTASVWDSGREFQRYALWYERINKLLRTKDRLSPLAVSSLLGFKALVELTGEGDIKKAYETYMKQRLWAEKAGAHSLMVYFAAACSYCLIWMGRLSEAEVIMTDAEVLCSTPDTNLVVRIYFQTTRGLFYFVKGKPDKAEEILKGVVSLPFFEELPPPAYFLGYGHLLLTVANKGKEQAIEAIAQKLRARAIPEQNYFHYSYLHYNLGTAYLMIGEPHKALVHGNEALERGRLSKSHVAEQIPALVFGQALSDMNKNDRALEHFLQWLKRWKKSGFFILASSGAFEIACLYLKMGMIDKAREYFKKASTLMPEGEKIAHLNRSEEFFKKIESSLYPSEKHIDVITDLERMPVCITTFGDLQIRVGESVIYDRKWRGGRTKTLLKALIVFGGTKVSYNLLIDTLWPDTEGDIAENNLKVAVSRLRRIGCRRGEKPIQWILVKQRKISLARPLCAVDSIIFKETVDRALKERKDIALLMKALDLYRDDFLARDQSETWIIRHREILREDFVKGAILLYELCRESGDINESLPYLYRAVERDPLDEEIYSVLMELYLELGYPSKAIQTYKQAEEILKKELDIAPGPALQALARKAGMKI